MISLISHTCVQLGLFKTLKSRRSPLVLIVLLSGHSPVSDSFRVSDLYRSIATEQSNLANRLVNKIVNLVIENSKSQDDPTNGKSVSSML